MNTFIDKKYLNIRIRNQDNHLDDFQSIPVRRKKISKNSVINNKSIKLKRHKKELQRWKVITTLGVLLLVYFIAPNRTNILILGKDYLPSREKICRTDTLILATIIPLKPYVALLSIPRDLWVNIKGVGENRINTAYFFAEINEMGSGPASSLRAIQDNFGISMQYYLLVDMEGLIRIIDSLGGIEVILNERIGGLEEGEYNLTGAQALAFARERYSSDDFTRMKQGQILINSILKKLLKP